LGYLAGSMIESSQSLLLEIGAEELPSSFVDGALAALPGIVADELAKARLSHADVRALGTPRRLAVQVRGVAIQQLDLDEEVVGPPEAVAFKDGKATRAAEAFATKLAAPLGSLVVLEKAAGPKQKAGRYVVGRRVEAGRRAMDLLGSVLFSVCAAIPFRKSMRWGNLETPFGRPVQWLVALFGTELVPLSFAGVHSGRASRGHRFLAPARFDVTSPDTYVPQLRERHVLADRAERVRTMTDRLEEQARSLGATYDSESALIDENASLVEEPYVIAGSFDAELLHLPAAVIRAVARGHQKYFCVQTSDDELLPHYLAVVNTANRPDLIAQGMDRVMRARLADARFFWQEDLKTPLDRRAERLGGIVFHNRLGTVREKVDRILRLSENIGRLLSLDEEARGALRRASLLCKSDLVTLMVGEFPELQGTMGRAYASMGGESSMVADAIRDHYKPVGAQDDVAPGDVAATLALADRFDTLAGCFAVGLAPTGTADPFALRRACIGVLRTMLDRGYSALSFCDLARSAYAGFDGVKLDLTQQETGAKLEQFATDRLRGLLAGATSPAVADAVIMGSGPAALDNVVGAAARARALQTVVDASEPWLDKAKTVAKRLTGISREAQPKLHSAASFAQSAKADDAVIQRLIADLDAATGSLVTESAVRDALMSMERVATELDRIFVETLVNDPADPFTLARLETLAHGAQSMVRIADFSRLG
jgi:glycyl-tRNA synthetase beta chain